jgi:hypothetical protein
MARILILIILAWIFYLIIKRIIANSKPKATAKADENFVQCARCGCHVPLSESQVLDSQIICNDPKCINNERNKK